ncbi:MAG: 5'/3'-nucleotidase SurE [Bacteroidetes bacterium HGW-Bacteroidetes-21]|nr:MAG: 5'/3'-nucleotidase SurE [Bacteroidetes bacterium HGW-Bacteroidetes-21]
MPKEANNKPLILVSNDDGVRAGGINALIELLRPMGDIWVVAPEKGESGMSHAISIARPVHAHLLKEEKNLHIYSCTGTPVDSVKLAINKILPRKPDFLVSGINHGSNASISVIYSGTMGAAIEGCLNGIPSVGFSLLNPSPAADFSVAVNIIREILKNLIEYKLPQGTCLNVNIPDIPLNQIKGIRTCRQTRGVWREEYDERTDPRGGKYYWLTGDFHNFEVGAKDTDEWALANNYVAIVPIEVDFTSYEGIKFLNNWIYGI